MYLSHSSDTEAINPFPIFPKISQRITSATWGQSQIKSILCCHLHISFLLLPKKKKKNLQTRMRHVIYQNGICLDSEAEDAKFLQNFILVLEIQFRTMISFSLLPWAVEELKQRWYFVFPLNMKVKKRNWQFCYPKSKS